MITMNGHRTNFTHTVNEMTVTEFEKFLKGATLTDEQRLRIGFALDNYDRRRKDGNSIEKVPKKIW